MTYTFWHSGILIGQSDLAASPHHPRQLGGVFRPTAYGVDVFPRLSGMLSAGHALKTHLDANGLSTEDMNRDEIDELLDSTSAGQKIIDIGRMMVDVEIRAPDGLRLEVASLAFTDLSELQRLIREMELEEAHDLTNLPPEAPRYIVSATVAGDMAASGRDARTDRALRRRWSANN